MIDGIRSRFRPRATASEPSSSLPLVLILTPMKSAAVEIDDYVVRMRALTYPHKRVSIGWLESDSLDRTWEYLQEAKRELDPEFRSVGLWKKDFGYHIPFRTYRGAPEIQLERRTVLAKSRNHLLSHALNDEEWVLWLDADVFDFPTDLIERMLETGRTIVQPHCVLDYGGPTFDANGWRDKGRLHLDDFRGEEDFVELDAVGGTILWIHADLHRDGLNFPAFPFGEESPFRRPERGEVETEGLGIMAKAMGHTAWGMPNFEVLHRKR